MRRAVGALLLTCIVGLAACGNDDEDRPRPTATVSPSASATANLSATATAVATATVPPTVTATAPPTPTTTTPPTATASPHAIRLRAGAAEGTLDLPIGLPLSGFVDENRNIFPLLAQPIDARDRPYTSIQVPSTGIHTRITVKALALQAEADELVVVKADLIFAYAGITEETGCRQPLAGASRIGSCSPPTTATIPTAISPRTWCWSWGRIRIARKSSTACSTA